MTHTSRFKYMWTKDTVALISSNPLRKKENPSKHRFFFHSIHYFGVCLIHFVLCQQETNHLKIAWEAFVLIDSRQKQM